MIEIGLTGGIGAGKSTVADLLVARGAFLIDADRIVRELQTPGAPVFVQMVERWGDAIVNHDGTLNRQAVAERVFTSTEELDALNAIVHPAVATEMAQRRAEVRSSGLVVLLDIPLLVRADGQSLVDQYASLVGIVVVDVDPEMAVARLVAHRGFTEDDARARLANQASREARRAVADVVIDNSGDVSALIPQVDAAWEWMRSLPHPDPAPDDTAVAGGGE